MDHRIGMTDQYGGAIFLDGAWHPFAWFTTGELDIADEGHESEQTAFDRYKEIFT